MKILVTGSEGNIGSELVPYLISKGHDVLCLDFLQKYRDNYILCDINNLSDADCRIEKFEPDAIIHMAAMVSRITCEKSPQIATNTNLTGTMNIINLAMKYNCKLINFSTSEVYGNQGGSLDEDVVPMPNNWYGVTKLIAENMVKYFAKTNKFTYVNLRPFMIYSEHENFGENRSAMIRFAENIILNKPIAVHDGAVRSWLHVLDAVAMIEKMLYLKENITLNMGNDEFVSMIDMAKTMCSIAGTFSNNDGKVEYPLIQVESLPDKMTLSKIASFELQDLMLSYSPKIQIKDGVYRVMKVVRKRIEDSQND